MGQKNLFDFIVANAAMMLLVSPVQWCNKSLTGFAQDVIQWCTVVMERLQPLEPSNNLVSENLPNKLKAVASRH